jgi:hypothetical protein
VAAVMSGGNLDAAKLRLILNQQNASIGSA